MGYILGLEVPAVPPISPVSHMCLFFPRLVMRGEGVVVVGGHSWLSSL